MTASSLLEGLRARGMNLSARAGKLVCDVPAGVLTDADRAALREYKAQLLALLTPPATPPAAPPPRPGAPKECFSREDYPQACGHCNGRVWRLRETPQSGGGWLWICAACAERFNDVMLSQVPTAKDRGLAHKPHPA